jgi:hypothetical protein
MKARIDVKERTMDGVNPSSELLVLGMIGIVAFLIVAVVLFGWLLWELGRVLTT